MKHSIINTTGMTMTTTARRRCPVLLVMAVSISMIVTVGAFTAVPTVSRRLLSLSRHIGDQHPHRPQPQRHQHEHQEHSRFSSSSVLHLHHQFNGGYNPSNLAVQWTPLQAAEFVLWQHNEDDAQKGNTNMDPAQVMVDNDHATDDYYYDVGRQLAPLIQHWSGTQVGEFLTRLYLGQKKKLDSSTNSSEMKLTFESKQVRNPQWMGLTTAKGFHALQDLLEAALPDRVLEHPAEIARFAESFLLKEHTWPKEDNELDETSNKRLLPSLSNVSEKEDNEEEDNEEKVKQQKLKKRLNGLPTVSLDEYVGVDFDNGSSTTSAIPMTPIERRKPTIALERDSFASLGHAANMGKLWGQLRKTRLDSRTNNNNDQTSNNTIMTVKDVLAMVVLPEQDAAKTEAQAGFLRLHDFWQHLGVQLTADDKITLVHGMAKGGWGPAPIAKFVSNIPQAKPVPAEVVNENVPLLQAGFQETVTAEVEEVAKEEADSSQANAVSSTKSTTNDAKDKDKQRKLNLTMPSQTYFATTTPTAASNNGDNTSTSATPSSSSSPGGKHNGQKPPTPSWLP